jgi:predicted O-linked N-acetylglucosamine transferase (SPINDLY family)
MATLSEAFATALAHHRAGRLEMAGEIYRRILQADAHQADARHLLGVIAHQSGRHAEAEREIREAIAVNPSVAAYHNNLGEVCRALGRLEEAAACYRRAMDIEPRYPDPHNNLGEVYRARTEFDEAAACYREAIELDPNYAAAHNNLGLALGELGQVAESAACFRRALDRAPNLAATWSNLGQAMQSRNDYDEALTCYERALALNPDYAGAHNNLGNAMRDQGLLGESLACYDRALHLRPDMLAACSNRLCALRCDPAVGPEVLAEAHAAFNRRFAAPLRAAWQAHANSRDPDRPLRLGFVSPAFCRGPMGSFLIRALENLDRTQYEIYCYSDRSRDDALSVRFQAASSAWFRTAGLSDEQLTARIRGDRIDVLFDLAGHAPHHRLLVFARRPAPIQITWIDSVGSSGLEAMDYVLADDRLIPRQCEAQYRERVLRMPHGYVCYEPADVAPAVAPLPAADRGFVTFGSFNQPAKIQAQVVRLWSEILRRVPDSRLVMKYRGLTGTLARRQYREWFEAEQIAAHRVELLPHSPLDQCLAEYRRIDIALDPFPHNGGLTTCDALWMGVPVVTCPGQTFASRQSLSHLSTIGLTETIAADLDEYVEIAVRLASDLPHLAALRAGLREQMAGSPLCDGKRFAQDFMAAVREAWREWVNSGDASLPCNA